MDESYHTEGGIEFRGETDAAVQIVTSEGEILWIPLSQVKSMERGLRAEDSSITMTLWIAKKKGLV
jgi:hypothetical protein